MNFIHLSLVLFSILCHHSFRFIAYLSEHIGIGERTKKKLNQFEKMDQRGRREWRFV